MEPLTYSEIDNLVRDYKWYTTSNVLEEQEYSGKCISELVQAFNPYILKWVSILSGADPNITDTEAIAFLSLFSNSNIYTATETMRKCFGDYERDELYNEILIRFIEVVIKFVKRDGVHFPGYLSSVFKYKMYRMVMGRVQELSREGMCVSLESIKVPDIEAEDSPLDITEDCTTISCLTRQESTLLNMYAYEGKSYDSIATYLGVNRREVWRQIRAIRDKVKRWIEEESTSPLV